MQIETYSPEEENYLGKSKVVHAYVSESKEHNVTLCGIAVNIIEKIGLFNAFDIYDDSQLSIILRDTIQAATILDIPFIYIPSFKKSEIKNKEDMLNMANILQQMCVLANKRNIIVASENTLNFHYTAKLIRLVNKPNFRILIDIYNPLLWGHDVCKIISYNHSYIANQVHIKDGNNGLMGNKRLGEGDSPVKEVLFELKSKKIKPIYIFENNYQVDSLPSAQQDIFAFKHYGNSFSNHGHLQKQVYYE